MVIVVPSDFKYSVNVAHSYESDVSVICPLP
jgi:hypothetical protein